MHYTVPDPDTPEAKACNSVCVQRAPASGLFTISEGKLQEFSNVHLHSPKIDNKLTYTIKISIDNDIQPSPPSSKWPKSKLPVSLPLILMPCASSVDESAFEGGNKGPSTFL
jgi:hypothetical protein